MYTCDRLPKSGDHQQRYEVSYYNPRDKKRHVFGWCIDVKSADIMRDCINKHPTWRDAKILDREKVTK